MCDILFWKASGTFLSGQHYPLSSWTNTFIHLHSRTQLGITAGLASLEMTAALHHMQLAFDERCWQSLSESREESKLSAEKVA